MWYFDDSFARSNRTVIKKHVLFRQNKGILLKTNTAPLPKNNLWMELLNQIQVRIIRKITIPVKNTRFLLAGTGFNTLLLHVLQVLRKAICT